MHPVQKKQKQKWRVTRCFCFCHFHTKCVTYAMKEQSEFENAETHEALVQKFSALLAYTQRSSCRRSLVAARNGNRGVEWNAGAHMKKDKFIMWATGKRRDAFPADSHVPSLACCPHNESILPRPSACVPLLFRCFLLPTMKNALQCGKNTVVDMNDLLPPLIQVMGCKTFSASC